MEKLFIAISFVFVILNLNHSFAQENVGIGTTNPDASSILELYSTDKGLLIPRLTDAQRNGITLPSNGLIIFNITSNRFEYNSGTTGSPVWVPLLTGSIIPLSNTNIFVGNASGIATGVVMSGDATISNTGALTIGNNAITNAKVSPTAEIAVTKLGNGTNNQIVRTNGTDVEWWTPTYLTTETVGSGTSAGGDLTGTYPNPTINNNVVDGSKINLSSNATGDMMYYNGTDWVVLTPGNSGYVLQSNGAGNAPGWANISGTVTSVGLDMPTNEFAISGSPITNNGTLTTTWKSQNQNLVLASPDATSGVPQFRSLVENDIPNIASSKITGSFGISQGGTNSTTALNNNRIMVSNGGAIVEAAELLDGQILIGSTGNPPTVAYLTAGTGIGLLTGAGTITISSNVTGITAGTVEHSTVRWDGDSYEPNDLILSSNAQLTLGAGGNSGTLKLYDATSTFHSSIITSGLLADRSYTVPEVGTNADFVMNQGPQNISGIKTFWGLTKTKNHLEILNSATANQLRFYEDSANGSNFIGFKAPTNLGDDFIFTLPVDDGTAGQVLSTDGTGILTWETASGSLPVGTDKHTLRFDGTNWVSNGLINNDGTRVGIGYTGTIADSLILHIAGGDVLIDGDLNVTGTIDPKALQLVPQSSAPVDASQEGFMYYDDNSKSIKITNGTSWSELGSSLNSDFELKNTDNAAKELRFFEASTNGSNYVAFKAPATLAGDIQYTLPSSIGGSDTFLKNDGSGNLSWGTVSETNIVAVNKITINYTATNSDYVILVNGGNFTVTLPTASGNTGKVFVIKKIGSGEFTIQANGSETIDGQNSFSCYSSCFGKSYMIVSDGSNWWVMSLLSY